VALTRHWDTCGSNPGVGGIFPPLFSPLLFDLICKLGQLQFLGIKFQSARLGESKGCSTCCCQTFSAGHSKAYNNKYFRLKEENPAVLEED